MKKSFVHAHRAGIMSMSPDGVVILRVGVGQAQGKHGQIKKFGRRAHGV